MNTVATHCVMCGTLLRGGGCPNSNCNLYYGDDTERRYECSCDECNKPESVLSEAARLVDGDRRDIIDSSLCATHVHSARKQKLDEHDKWAALAVAHLASWLHAEADLLIAIARGRHAEGSLRYGDRLMYEYTQDELLAEASQELGDAINYLSLYIRRWAEGADGA